MDAALSVRNLRAYYVTDYFGIKREVRAVDDITLSVKKNEIYGIAGEVRAAASPVSSKQSPPPFGRRSVFWAVP